MHVVLIFKRHSIFLWSRLAFISLTHSSSRSFTIRLSENPTHKSAGYFVQIPDGGILPRPYAQPIVVTADGSAVKSYVLWQNGAQGVSLILALRAKLAEGDPAKYLQAGERGDDLDGIVVDGPDVVARC